MIAMTPVTAEGQSESRFGRAPLVAVVEVEAGQVSSWQVHEVGWDVLHDASPHGVHHATVMKFLKEHNVGAVVAADMGAGMARMLDSAKIAVLPATKGDAKASLLAALANPERTHASVKPVIQPSAILPRSQLR